MPDFNPPGVTVCTGHGQLPLHLLKPGADLTGVRDHLATVETGKAQALKRVAALTTELDEARAAARDDSSIETEPAAEASPSVQSGQPARTRAEAREAVLVHLGEDLTDRKIARRVGVSPSTVAAVRKIAP